MKIVASIAITLTCLTLTACGSPPAPAQGPVRLAAPADVGPPPAISTPVPIVLSRPNLNAGRADPFAPLAGVPRSSTPTRVSNRFPKIPTLPGFEGAPNGAKPASVWDGVRVTGIVQANGYSAIIEAGGKSYVAREGDSIAGTLRVVAIGPGYVTLSSAEGVRNFSLGG